MVEVSTGGRRGEPLQDRGWERFYRRERRGSTGRENGRGFTGESGGLYRTEGDGEPLQEGMECRHSTALIAGECHFVGGIYSYAAHIPYNVIIQPPVNITKTL